MSSSSECATSDLKLYPHASYRLIMHNITRN